MAKKFSEFTEADALDYIAGLKDGDNAKIPYVNSRSGQQVFTTNSGGDYTSTEWINKNISVFGNEDGTFGTLVSSTLYSFSSLTGAITGLSGSTKYLVMYFPGS